MSTEVKNFCWFDGNRWNVQGRDLHCGDCFQVKIDGAWHDVRIELSGAAGWYLIGLPPKAYKHIDAYQARHYA